MENDSKKTIPPELRRIIDRLSPLWSRELMSKQLNYRLHNSYDQELREQTAIELGNTDLLTAALAEELGGELGTLTRHGELRNALNIGIIVISLAARSAIRGGLLPEQCFSMADVYIRALEECRTTGEIMDMVRACEYELTCLVRESQNRTSHLHRDAGSYHADRARKYVFAHLHQHLTVEMVAEALDLSPDYLSAVFKKTTGGKLGDYITGLRIDQAKELLTYSEYSLSEIAAFLGFSSQSHMGVRFRKAVGCTPGEYRRMYGRQTTAGESEAAGDG